MPDSGWIESMHKLDLGIAAQQRPATRVKPTTVFELKWRGPDVSAATRQPSPIQLMQRIKPRQSNILTNGQLILRCRVNSLSDTFFPFPFPLKMKFQCMAPTCILAVSPELLSRLSLFYDLL